MSPQNQSKTMEPPPSGVKVRMYNQGFGDCFLLAFRARDGSGRYMLLDCGVHHQYPDRDERMKKVARSIADATGRHLHVVAVTHEHTDHLYGFKYARSVFETIEMDTLWLAWTEDPADPVARELKEKYTKSFKALTGAISRLKKSNPFAADALQRVAAFESPGALAATSGNAAQLDYLRSKCKNEFLRPEHYRRPGEPPLTLDDVPGVKVYILGPPRDTKMIRKMEKKSELYMGMAGLTEEDTFIAAVLGAGNGSHLEDGERALVREGLPFGEALGVKKEDAERLSEYGDFYRQHYGFSSRKGHAPQWRRIDDDWLRAAEQLALSINNKTNNTSLTFAIELTESHPRKVLLFAADAQVGNWLSWQPLTWEGEGEDGSDVDTPDLLSRTVFYKTGHHGSHNATLRGKGLEMMDSPDLVSCIPVDSEWAEEVMDWEHPDPKVLERLLERTEGRVFRTDEIPKGNKKPPKASNSTKKEWKAYLKDLDWDRSPDRLWIEYTVRE